MIEDPRQTPEESARRDAWPADGKIDLAVLTGPGVAEMTRLYELDAAVRRILGQRLDDLCWRDAYTELAGLVGMEFNPDLLPREAFLANCGRFHGSLAGGPCYVAPVISEEEAAGLRAENASLKTILAKWEAFIDGLDPKTEFGIADGLRLCEAMRPTKELSDCGGLDL